MIMETLEKTPRTTVKRLPTRADYNRETINEILDEGFVCHERPAVQLRKDGLHL